MSRIGDPYDNAVMEAFYKTASLMASYRSKQQEALGYHWKQTIAIGD